MSKYFKEILQQQNIEIDTISYLKNMEKIFREFKFSMDYYFNVIIQIGVIHFFKKWLEYLFPGIYKDSFRKILNYLESNKGLGQMNPIIN